MKKVNFGKLCYNELNTSTDLLAQQTLQEISFLLDIAIGNMIQQNQKTIFSNVVASMVQDMLQDIYKNRIYNTVAFKAFLGNSGPATSKDKRYFLNSVIGAFLYSSYLQYNLKFVSKVGTGNSGYIIYKY